MKLLFIAGFSLLGSIGSIALAGLFLLSPEKTRQILIPCFVSYATGSLLGAAFLGLIPHALGNVSISIFPVILTGIILFFILEKLIIWRHCHSEACEFHKATGSLILIGGALHNFMDGIIIATTFLTSVPLGIATSLAIIFHEIPQEVGDFAILLDSGYSREKAFMFNILSGLSSLFGAMLAYFILRGIQTVIPYFMALSASSFIYISMADLIPGLNRYIGLKQSVRQLVLILAGITTIAIFHMNH